VTAAHEPVAQPGHAQSADKPVDQPGDTHACAGLDPKPSGLEGKNRDEEAVVAEIRAAIRAATGAEVSPEDIHALTADYPLEAVLGKVRLLADMGRQELRNVPGLLRYLLAEDCRHIPGRPQRNTRAAPEKAKTDTIGERSKEHGFISGKKRERPRITQNPHNGSIDWDKFWET